MWSLGKESSVESFENRFAHIRKSGSFSNFTLSENGETDLD